jgi:hypothetical protein
VCDHEDTADGVGEDELVEGVIKTKNKKVNAFLTKCVNTYNTAVSY